MNLVVDIGNTSVKTALFEGMKMISLERCDSGDVMIKVGSMLAFYDIDSAIVSSVTDDAEDILNLFRNKGCYVHHLTGKSKYPFASDYLTPDTLGVDRLAAAAGAVALFGAANIMIIDAGSAVTIDIITGKTFRGGSISPGMEMRFKALHSFTGRLPLCSFSDEIPFPPRSTKSAINTGVVKGLVFELNEYIRTFVADFHEPVVILTGGDSLLLAGLIEREFISLPNLVPEGLNYLLDFNREQAE